MALAAVGAEKTRAIRPSLTFEGHTSVVRGVIHLPGRKRIMTCSWDCSMRIWNLQSGKQIGKDWRDEESKVNAMALSPGGKQVVTGSAGGAVKLWDIDTGKVITKWTVYARSVRWTQDGGRVLIRSGDGMAGAWDMERGETILEIKTGLDHVYSAIYSPDEIMIATGGFSKEKEYIKIFDAKTGKLVANLKGHTSWVNCLAWTADGTTLISGSADESIRTWNTTTWQQINVLIGHTHFVHDIAISPNGRILVSSSLDHAARLWDLENGRPIALPLQHSKAVRCASFSTDGKLLTTGCDDNNAYTWDIPTILREAGLSELLSNPNSHKSLLEADATQRPAQRRRRDNINPNRPLPPGFFDDSPRCPPPSRRRPLSPSPARQHHVAGHLSSDGRTLLGRLSSLLRLSKYNSQDVPSTLRFLEWARNPFFNSPRRRNDGGLELQERLPEVFDVPFTAGKPRNVSAAQVRTKKEKERAKKAKNARAYSSQPAQGSVSQQSGGAVQAQPTSEQHPTVATSSTASVFPPTFALTTLTTSPPDAMILRAGCWTRFWLFVCCAPAQYTDGHH